MFFSQILACVFVVEMQKNFCWVIQLFSLVCTVKGYYDRKFVTNLFAPKSLARICDRVCVFSQLTLCVMKSALCPWRRRVLFGTASVSSSCCFRGGSSSVFTFSTCLLTYKHQRVRRHGESGATCWTPALTLITSFFTSVFSDLCAGGSSCSAPAS